MLVCAARRLSGAPAFNVSNSHESPIPSEEWLPERQRRRPGWACPQRTTLSSGRNRYVKSDYGEL